jgi:hypothetical protein
MSPRPDPSDPVRRVAVTGATGLIGTALVESLRRAGNEVVRVVRRSAGPGDCRWDPAAGTIDAAALEGVDAVVHLAGTGIADRKWTAAHKADVMASRVAGTRLLATTLASLERRPRVLASGSAVGFYGDRGDEVLTESSPTGTGFLAEVVRAWEAETAPALEAGIRVAHLRTGIVMTTRGGALAQQLLPFRLGLGGRLGKGSQWLPWISLADEVRAIEHVITNPSISGPVNLVGPAPVTNVVFTRALGRALKRPTVLPIPLLPLKVRYGAEMVREMLLSSTRAVPNRLLDAGFVFEHGDIDTALRHLIESGA